MNSELFDISYLLYRLAKAFLVRCTNYLRDMRRTSSQRVIFKFGLTVGVILLALGTVWAGTARLSRDLQALQLIAGGHGHVDVIVSFQAGSDLEAELGQLQTAGATVRHELPLLGAAAARVPMARLSDLSARTEVRSIALDAEVTATTHRSVPFTGAALAQQALGLDGRGVRVAVVDSGVEPVAGGAPLAHWVDLVEPDAVRPSDPFGHGTHVAGIIAGRRISVRDPGEKRHYGGMAPAAEIVSVRVLDSRGHGRVSDVMAGIEWVLAHGKELDIRILNLSLGGPSRDPASQDPLVQACEAAWRAGLLVVVSAGNLGRETPGYGGITSPGNSASVLTVGALAGDGMAYHSASYSSRGPTRFDGFVKPDLLAPGDQLVSLRSPGSFLDGRFPGNRVAPRSRGAGEAQLFRLSGTSMAAATVSGAAALLLSGEPAWTPDQLKARLMQSAARSEEDVFSRGAGALDVMAAADLAPSGHESLSARAVRDELSVYLLSAPSLDLEATYGPEASWNAATLWEHSELWDVERQEQLVWQVPPPAEPGVLRLWIRLPDDALQTSVWQLVPSDAPTAESVVWQDRAGAVEPFAGQESVVWQGRPVSLSDGRDSPLSQEMDGAQRIRILGEGGEDSR
jgi:serine protease AprX